MIKIRVDENNVLLAEKSNRNELLKDFKLVYILHVLKMLLFIALFLLGLKFVRLKLPIVKIRPFFSQKQWKVRFLHI